MTAKRKQHVAGAALPKQYDPTQVEDRIYQLWLDRDTFHADVARDGTPFTIVIPPPNITNVLHMGQGLNNAIQDITIRWKRLCGFNTLWMPGTDHAGIATQNVIERELAKQGLSRHDLGRDKFVERCWQWYRDYGSTIIAQLKKMGCSCDWVRERFTMDEGLSNAVQEVFIRLYEKGLIYRGNYIINWCPRCHTALSDEEARAREREGKLYYIRYPIKGSDEFIVVATTRPETMLGDVAVAFHPSDERLETLSKRMVVLPILNRELKVIADEYVDPKFGTGIVKVTPAHDPNDFLMGQRHGLTPINVMHGDATMNENAGPYEGLDRFVCRQRLLEDLDTQGLIEKIEKHIHAVGQCYRCDDIVEPRLSLQWFVKMKPLAEPAIRVVREERVAFYPKRWTKVYLDWMENIRDWCISRQIWWGHRIPIWYCESCEEPLASKGRPTVPCRKCRTKKFRQDEDVLDTWFSSWLWPFSTLGWPEVNDDLKFFYPTDTLVTAPEIIFFWVARMIMAGLEFVGDIPFRDVYIHGTVRDETGTKMSKSLGNIIDPREIIDEFGADALRFSIIMITAQGQDVFLSKKKFEIGRNFVNKVWNASRFVLSNLEGYEPAAERFPPANLPADETYVLGKLNEAIGQIDAALTKYRLNEAAATGYDFFWHHFCDRYIEHAKHFLYHGTPDERWRTQCVLLHCLSQSLRLLHPFIPFVTEAIWQLLPGRSEDLLVVARWPSVLMAPLDPTVIRSTECKYEIVSAGRNLRIEYGIAPATPLRYIVKPHAPAFAAFLRDEQASLERLLNASRVEIDEAFAPDGPMPSAVTQPGTVYLVLKGEVDIEAERRRLEKDLAKLQAELQKARSKLRNKTFLDKAPKDVIEREKAKLEEFSQKAEKIERSLAFLK